MAPRTRIPILLLTGFLGSGKTSLLSKWLRAPEFFGAMVIVNELGEVGLDDRLVQFSSDGPVLLENGCACCEAAEDLTATLERLFWQRLHRQIPKFEWMLIETTGMADPAPIIASVVTNDLVAERYSLAGVVTAFDARRGPDLLLQHPECRSQIIQADIVLLTKTGIATQEEITSARSAVAAMRPDIGIFESSNGDVAPALIVETLQTFTARDRQPIDADAPQAEHSTDVTSAFAAMDLPIETANFHAALAAVMQRYGKRILRLKGIVNIDRESNPQVIQVVPGEPVAYAPLPAHDKGAAVKPGLTIIAQFVPAELIARDFLSMLRQDEVLPATPVFPQQVRG